MYVYLVVELLIGGMSVHGALPMVELGSMLVQSFNIRDVS